MTIRKQLRNYFLGRSRRSKRLLLLLVDSVVLFLAAVAVSYFLYSRRFTELQLLLAGVVSVITTAAVGWRFEIYNAIVRYVGLQYFHRVNATVLIATAITVLVLLAAGIALPPLKWGLAYWTLAVVYLNYSRFIASSLLAGGKSPADRERVVVYGAGSAGSQLAHCLVTSGQTLPVAFIDDDEGLYGTTVNGVRVYPPDDLGVLIDEQSVTRVLLAIPSASVRRRSDIIEILQRFPVHVQTIPDIQDLVTGKSKVDEVREIELADLMGREQIDSDPQLLAACITDKVVLVTGAGGSIGSELCRQILSQKVKTLVLLDICEPSLYRIESQLRTIIEQRQLNCELFGLLGSVDDQFRVDEILQRFQVQTIYHAAAYKHVPIVEQNYIPGLQNNAIGTLMLALAACKAKVESFVLISTDKAVRPTSVMGASKRLAELILQGYQEDCDDTCFSMVRFGNVLESSGSVVPLFREQIKNGGPVTVTHPDIVRYFMTIQEAAELVIQAGSMAEGGDVFVLDMGQPVKIRELAKRMILLSGLSLRDDDNPDGDIEITFTGLRPGEKLFEELLVGTNVSGTRHPRIMRAMEEYLPMPELRKLLGELQLAMGQGDRERIRNLLVEAVYDYQPDNGIDDLAWEPIIEPDDTEFPSNVSVLPDRNSV